MWAARDSPRRPFFLPYGVIMSAQVDMYRAARERLRAARLRGEDTELFENVIAGIWSMMSDADRRLVLGVAESRTAIRRAA